MEWLGAQHDGVGCNVADLNCLQSPIKEVLQPITKRGFRGRLMMFVYQLLGVLNPELKPVNSISTHTSF